MPEPGSLHTAMRPEAIVSEKSFVDKRNNLARHQQLHACSKLFSNARMSDSSV